MAENKPLDIPEFLRVPQEDRKAAWDSYRRAHPLPRETKKTLPPLGDPKDVDSE